MRRLSAVVFTRWGRGYLHEHERRSCYEPGNYWRHYRCVGDHHFGDHHSSAHL